MSNYSDSSFDANSANTSWYKVFNLIAKKTRVLDVGCSSGNFGVELINRKGCTVDGIELDPADAKSAAKKLGKVWVLNIEHDSLDDIPAKSYDVIYFGDVIEHLVDPVASLKRVQGLLKEGGHVVFSIPNMGHVGVRLALLNGNFDYTETGLLDKTHLHFYTEQEVNRVFGEAGFHIDSLDFVRKDYPKDLLREQLNGYGLEPNEVFFDKMKATNASAFQFVGSAAPAKITKHALPEFGPIDLFETFHSNIVADYKKKVAKLEAELVVAHAEATEATALLKHKTAHPYRALAGHYKYKIKR